MKRFIILFSLIVTTVSAYAQEASDYFINIPDELVPPLENEWRKDLVDLYKTGKEARLRNVIGGESVLVSMNPTYLLVETTERSTLEMKLLPLVNNTYIICLIHTVKGPVADSRIAFYTTEWQPLTAEDLFTPVAIEWFFREHHDLRPDMELIHYTLDPERDILLAAYTTPLYLSAAEREKLNGLLKDQPKEYIWDKSRFR